MGIIDAGYYSINIKEYAIFDKENRCSKCGGVSTYKFHILRHWMAGRLGEVMKRTCKDCGHQWIERLI